MLLEVQGLRVTYGRSLALEGLSLECGAGEVVCLVGPNGAGKTSAVSAIAGMPGRTVTGTILIEGRRVNGLSADAIARMGVSLVPESRRAFADLTVLENLRIGTHRLTDGRDREGAISQVFNRIPVLGTLRDRPAGKLSGGEQQLLVIARAVIGRPRVLLLDEPSLGLSPIAIKGIYELIESLVKQDGMALVLVEQNALSTLELADRCVVLRSGRVEMQGNAREMRHNQQFLDAYFGVAQSLGGAA